MKGIILAGGTGSRLYPITRVVSKQLLPVYDKPMIYFPLTNLMLSGIRDIQIITTKEHQQAFQTLLGNGHQWGINISWCVQDDPNGIAEAFILSEDFIGDDHCTLALGDNILFGNGLVGLLQSVMKPKSGATVFAYRVKDPENYGVVSFDEKGIGIDIEEKPQHPKSNYALIGLYCYDNSVVKIARDIKPTLNNEKHITDINNHYLKQGNLHVQRLGRGYAWLDAGTVESLHNAAAFVRSVESRQGIKIACPEEISWRMGYITSKDLNALAKNLMSSGYGQYLQEILLENNKKYDIVN
ncbi:glucose-1-phosphate thymidylyltransferase [Kiloniella spongiae]|uniref:Glucose-1-phosphate thymidylyltransferase n=1 Tax=Kiloniella spongiae TaxID=1489064 RepID=A0A0H2MDK9_9PROT|nr:glucose-1-phosphate thymidylyltransferase RfbA [Kiloniella spongiae]KLN60311.1 glucose-1-phosphate thymidylyltransferase [Kiloniella spongiae]